MYFESRIFKNETLPWFDSRSKWEKKSNAYFEKLEDLLSEIDGIECETDFLSDLDPDDFSSGYNFVLARIKEIRRYIRSNQIDDEDEDLLDSLHDIQEDLVDLEGDALLYDDDLGDDLDDDVDGSDDFDDDDIDDDDF